MSVMISTTATLQRCTICVDDCQNCRDPHDSWADCDTPVSTLFPVGGGSNSAADYSICQVSKGLRTHLIVRNQNEAFSEFHRLFQSEFSPTEEGFGYRQGFGYGPRYRTGRDINQLLHGNYISWCVVQSSRAVWVEPRSFLSDNEVYSANVDSISKNSPILRAIKPGTSRKTETLGNSEEDVERVLVTADPITRLVLESLNGQVTRTEWKVTRLQLIRLMKDTASGLDNYHRVPTVGDTPDASSDVPSSFEQRAIEQLQLNLEENVVTNYADGEIHVVRCIED